MNTDESLETVSKVINKCITYKEVQLFYFTPLIWGTRNHIIKKQKSMLFTANSPGYILSLP